jgi:hypothetical protein
MIIAPFHNPKEMVGIYMIGIREVSGKNVDSGLKV